MGFEMLEWECLKALQTKESLSQILKWALTRAKLFYLPLINIPFLYPLENMVRHTKDQVIEFKMFSKVLKDVKNIKLTKVGMPTYVEKEMNE